MPASPAGASLELGRQWVARSTRPAPRRPLPRLEYSAQFILDVLLVVGQAPRQRGQLLPDEIADAAQKPHRDDDRQYDRSGAWQADTLQEANRRYQGEAQEHRQGQGLEDFAREVQEGDDGEDQHREFEGIGQWRSLALEGHDKTPGLSMGAAARSSQVVSCGGWTGGTVGNASDGLRKMRLRRMSWSPA